MHYPEPHVLNCSVVTEKGFDYASGKEILPGDLYVENGAWYGRIVEGGFLCLYTGVVNPLDNSLWERREKRIEKSSDDGFGDDIPF